MHKRMLASFSLVILLVSALGTLASPVSADGATLQLTDNGVDDCSPQIHDGQVVWQGEDDYHYYQIFLYNGTAVVQLTDIPHHNQTHPDIHNGQVVWEGWDGNDREIFMYDGTTTIQLTDNGYDDYDPDIHNGQVTWEAWDGERDVFLYNGTTTIQLGPSAYDQCSPRIHNGQVVWYGNPDYPDDTDWEIYLYNGTTTIRLTDNSWQDDHPEIHNGQVVWESGWASTSEIYLYDGTTTVQLTDNSYGDHWPHIHDGQVVWYGYVDGDDSEIFLYDGATTTQLTDNSYEDFHQQIHKGQVVWVSGIPSDWSHNEVFLYDGTTTTQLTDNSYEDWLPRIDNGQVVWFGYDGHDLEIFLYTPPTPRVEEIDALIQDLPNGAFKNNPDQQKNALSEKLDEVAAMIDAEEYQEAINKLTHDIRAKVDGCVDGNPANDWIIDPVAQADLCQMIDDLIAYLETL